MLELVKYVVEQFAEHKDAIEYKEEEKENVCQKNIALCRSQL